MLNYSRGLNCLVVALASSAFAGPDWDEGGTDSGPLPGSAQTIASTSGGATTRISGRTASALFIGEEDLVDMYLVKTGDAASLSTFKITMNMLADGTGSPVWNARLSIFKKVTVNCDGVATIIARPIATVVKFSVADPYPILDGSATLFGVPGQKLSNLLSPNTEYFITVSGSDYSAWGSASPPNDCDTMPFSQVKELFNSHISAVAPGIHRAKPSYSNTGKLKEWRNTFESPSGVATGSYSIPTEATFPLPASGCTATVPVVGNEAWINVDMGFAPSIGSLGQTIPCAESEIVERQFYFNWAPTCSGKAWISSCNEGLAFNSAMQVFLIDAAVGDVCGAAGSDAIACSDYCEGSSGSEFYIQVESGQHYLVRLMLLGQYKPGAGGGSLAFYVYCDTPPLGDCCVANPGQTCCSNADTCAVVCKWSPSCCTEEWDQYCADLALKAGFCDPPPTGDCCVANPGQTCCSDQTCCEMVCALDAYCCKVVWDEACAALANQSGCCGGWSP